MAYIKHIKLGLACVIIFQIVSLFYLLHIYNKFVSNPDNYFKNYLTQYQQTEE
jgi:hypothetical protein